MRILITGIAGCGGSALARLLLRYEYQVTGVDIIAPLEASRLADILDKIDYRWRAVGDLTEEDVRGHDIICDFAAQADVPMGYFSPRWTCQQNLPELIHLLEIARGASVRKFIYPGSGTIFGRPLYLPIDENHPVTPANPYSATKAAAELLCLAYYRCYGVPVIILRNGVVYGPYMRKEIFIYKFLANIMQGLPVVIEGGDQTRDPCYTDDAMQAWQRIIEAPESTVIGESFQISTGQEYSVLEIARKCMEIVGNNVETEIVDYRPGEKGMRECFDISKARTILGYNPNVSIEEGLRLTADWVEKELAVNGSFEKATK